MKKSSNILLLILVFLAIGVGIYFAIQRKETDHGKVKETKESTHLFSVNEDGDGDGSAGKNGGLDFVSAANAVMPAIVHIKTTYSEQGESRNPFESDFGPGGRQNLPAMGSGSGVCIHKDGYIATNNHVIENATRIEVIFPDRRSFEAKLVGRDPNTDLALLKVNATDLPVVQLGNSDKVQIGEWVLAVGYPYSLNTTVTAGIISAKGRSIGIINQSNSAESSQPASTAIESFIQTDAAINPGNSGGALVNLDGKLIGINAAIASLTGSYAGYAFAIPVNLAKKILGDLQEFGKVKRGILGVSFPSPEGEDAYLKQQGINPASVVGVFLTGIQEGSAADEAGLKEGDIIQKIDGITIASSSEFSERIARHRPKDTVELAYLRNGKIKTISLTLKGEESLPEPPDKTASLKDIYNKLGAKFSPLTPAMKQHYQLNGGVLVSEVRQGGFFDRVGIPPGTIIAYINGREINTPADIDEALVAAQNSRVQILAVAPDGSKVIFNFSLGA